jgi:hypothetical protein
MREAGQATDHPQHPHGIRWRPLAQAAPKRQGVVGM